MKIIIAGGSGLIGSALSRFLRRKGHHVVCLSRTPNSVDVFWDPKNNRLDPAALEGCDAVINLAGESIAGGRWTAARKKQILDSRLQATFLLANTIRGLQNPPAVFINASAIGFYGDQGDKILDEASHKGGGFLADVCGQWEEAALSIHRENVRVVVLRIGVVLSKEGGALSSMLTAFRLGLGGRVGSGLQYMSWISLNDLVCIIEFILCNERLEGPVNAVAPCPVTNYEFTKTLGKVLKRPAILPLPAFVARLVFGELADELLLGSIRVHPSKLQKAGYTYCNPRLGSALRKELYTERDSKF